MSAIGADATALAGECPGQYRGRHAKIESTVRYVGLDVEDALELAERTEVQLTHKATFARRFRLPSFRRSFIAPL